MRWSWRWQPKPTTGPKADPYPNGQFGQSLMLADVYAETSRVDRDPVPLRTDGNQARLLALADDGTVVWESPAGWAAGGRLVEFVHPESRFELEDALGAVTLGMRERAIVACAVVDPDGGWRDSEVMLVSTSGTACLETPFRDSVLVSITDAPLSDFPSSPIRPPTSTDDLTGLSDRSALAARLERAESEDEPALAVLYLDLDSFKEVNDHLGHSTGDRVLMAVADRLRAAIRPGDLVSRIGGDEFVVVARGVSTDERALEIAERIRSSIAEPIQLGGRKINSTMSIGLAVGTGENASELLERADAAMYGAKDLGRNQALLYSPTDRSMRHRATGPEELLRSALDDGLVIVYEPVVSLQSAELTSIEASLRLRGEDGHLGSPDSLLRLAERSGLIVSLGAGMLDLACREADAWSGPIDSVDPGPGLTWPITGKQLDEPRSCDQILAILDAHKLPAQRLVLQVSEASLLKRGAAARHNLDGLHQAGVSLAVGDFGSGAASLSLLLEFSFEVLKLDPAFMTGFGEERRSTDLVDAILAFGRTLRVQTVARGVGTKAQVELLRYMGCDAAQGPYFGQAATMGEARFWGTRGTIID
jgi:diguanylate cyclase (GGDEF)-like protein